MKKNKKGVLARRQEEADLKFNFNLKQVKERQKLTQIMLVTTINRKRIRIYTKLRVEPQYWDNNNYRCVLFRSLTVRDKKRLKFINDQLDELVSALLDTDDRLANKGEYLSMGVIQRIVKEVSQKTQADFDPISSLRGLVDDYEKKINRKGQKGIESTKVTYYTALDRLVEYNKQRKNPINSFDDFNRIFFADFTNFLYNYQYTKGGKTLHYTQNTVVNTLKVIKNLLHRAYDNEMTANNYYLRVQTTLPADSSDQIYLNEDEIQRFSQVKTLTDQEREVRDMFVIACFTALRISDIQQLNNANINNGVISLYQTKTKDLVDIPILKEISPLIERYKESGFPVIDKIKANRIVKSLAERCRLNEEVSHKEHRGGSASIITTPKFNLVSFHTARRSCVTNLYKRGYPINYIMTLSGHRSIQAFQRYLRASSKELMTDFFHLLKKDKAL